MTRYFHRLFGASCWRDSIFAVRAGVPAGPVGPVGPVFPVGPVLPVAPVGPVGPVAGPVGPVGPVAAAPDEITSHRPRQAA